MRNFVIAGLLVLGLGLNGAAPARAAVAWECMGPPAACLKVTTADVRKPVRASRALGEHLDRKIGKPKKIASYQLRHAKAKPARPATYASAGSHTGVASYYSHGQRTASGSRFNPNGLTAAHRTLPFGTRVVVTNLTTGRSVTVTINDRGPFIKGRIIDLSRGAASVIGMTSSGVARVSVDVLGRG